MRDLGCHPDLFQLAVIEKQIVEEKKEEEEVGGVKIKIVKKEQTKKGIVTSCSKNVNITTT